MIKNNFLSYPFSLLVLIFILATTLIAIVPTLSQNIDDPNLIVYFNKDAGYRMDIIWRHFSGEVRPSYQGDYEYGLLLAYLADFAKFFLSHFITVTPGTFVFILRFLNLLFWIGALIGLWNFVTRHFASGWQAALAVLVLATRPAFGYSMDGLKPDPIVLFFIIIGLDYCLRFLEDYRNSKIFIAIACSSIALIIKFSGVFLLPAIVASIYFAKRFNKQSKSLFIPEFKMGWLALAFSGLIFSLCSVSVLFFYKRGADNLTWYQEYGLWQSILANRIILYFVIFGIFLIAFSVLLWALGRLGRFKKTFEIFKEINSSFLIVLLIFFGLTLILGFKWVINPQFFSISYYHLMPFAVDDSFKKASSEGILFTYIFDIFLKIKEFGFATFLLFALYLTAEYATFKSSLRKKPLVFFKRIVLAIFIIFFILFIFLSLTRATQVHMLPFIACMLILGFQGVCILAEKLSFNKALKNIFFIFVFLIIGIQIFQGAQSQLKWLSENQGLSKDKFSEFSDWWKANIPDDSKIVSDHHSRVYVPAGYNNIKFFKGYEDNRIDQLKELVASYKPEFVYYNENARGGIGMPVLDEIFPRKNFKLIKVFDSENNSVIGNNKDRFLIYKMYY